jgi:anti-sigma B factor antagonist
MSVHFTKRTRHDQPRAPGTASQQQEVDGLASAPGAHRWTYELTLTGALDLAGAPLLEAILREAIASGWRDIHLDLAAVSFLDTAGLSVLVTAQSQLSGLHGRLVLQEPSWSVRRLVCLADLCPLLGLDTGRNPCRHNHADAAGSRYPAAGPIEKDTPLRVTGADITVHATPVHAA